MAERGSPILGVDVTKAPGQGGSQEECSMRDHNPRLHSRTHDRCIARAARERFGQFKAELHRGDVRRGARRPSPEGTCT